MTVFVLRHRPSGRRVTTPPVAYPHQAQPGGESPLSSEERLVCHAGVPASDLRWLRFVALRWGVSLRKAACAARVVDARRDAEALAGMCRLKPSRPRTR